MEATEQYNQWEIRLQEIEKKASKGKLNGRWEVDVFLEDFYLIGSVQVSPRDRLDIIKRIEKIVKDNKEFF